MLSRALSLATVTLLVGCLTAGGLLAVENLEAGKSPSQIFSGTCTACHKSPRGLLKTVPASSLPGFLRQHYTTSSDMASVLSSFLISNGATDTRFQSKDQPKGAKQEARPDQPDRSGRRQHPAASTQEASRPDADPVTPQEGGRPGRDGKRRPGPTQDGARPDSQTPAQAATDSKAGAKHKLGKRGKPEETPKTDEAAKDDSSKTAKVDGSEKPEIAKPAGEGRSDTGKSDTDKADTSKADTSKPDATKPETAKSETAKVDAPRESVGSEPTPLRPDPVPPVTPAPPASAAPAAAASGTPEPASIPSPPVAAPAPPTPPAVTASTPPPPSAAPAGPPVPPISQ
ncbi:MAG: hypothetical protein J0H42_26180 [Rhizobiales bacterium]|nr:hypothetical protein [Hyphomicrobiales bacterium]